MQTSPEVLCESLGIKNLEINSSVPIDEKNFKVISNPTFKVGTIGSRGYLYLPAFGLYGYREKCESEWEKFQTYFKGECDKACLWKFEYNVMRQALITDIESAIKSLNSKSIDTLIVDVSNNGGGSDWVDTVARVVGSKPLKCQKVAKLKNKTTRRELVEMKKEISMTLSQPVTKSAKEVLEQSLKNINGVLEEFGRICDRSNYWKVPGFKPKCNTLTTGNLFACGHVPYAKPESLAGLDIRQPIFKSSDFKYKEQLFKGDLVILVNRNTSSSAEEFVSLLRDNIPSVKVVGEHTNSTGCGYMNGGNPITLAHSGLVLNMSNCVRYQKDGTNEVFGNYPDVELNWDNIDSHWLKKVEL